LPRPTRGARETARAVRWFNGDGGFFRDTAGPHPSAGRNSSRPIYFAQFTGGRRHRAAAARPAHSRVRARPAWRLRRGGDSAGASKPGLRSSSNAD
jgi:hypothetical protein